jgi:hypothetical protein
METTDRSPEETRVDAERRAVPAVSAYSTTKERMVFTEAGNGDGWIATDLAVEARR